MRPAFRHRLLSALGACLCLLPACLSAQTTLYWDLNGAASGLNLGDGTWDTTTANWTTAEAGDAAPVVWTNGSIATFKYDSNITDSVVTLGTDITLASLIATSNPQALTIEGNGHQITLTGAAEIAANALGDFNINAVIAGTNGLNKTGDYALTLAGANTYTGVTSVDGSGRLYVYDNAALGATGVGNETVVNSGGVGFGDNITTAENFILNGGNLFVETEVEHHDVTLTGSIVLQGDAQLSGDRSIDSRLFVNGVISESGGSWGLLADNGVTLSGNNTFTGRVTAGDGGGLFVNVFNNNGEAGPLGMGNGLLLGYVSEGTVNGQITYTGSTATSDRTIQLVGYSNQIAIANSGTTLTLTGEISDEPCIGSDGDLVKSGPGTLVLSGDNSYQGNTDIVDGTLVAGHDHALGTGEESEVRVGVEGTAADANLGLLLADGVTLDRYVYVYNGNNDGGTTTLGLSGAGEASFGEEVYITRNIDVNVGSGGTLNFNEFFYDGNGGGSITKTGGGLMRFQGGFDLRNGGLTINGGEVRVSPGESNLMYFQNGITVNSGGVLSGLGNVQGGGLTVTSGGTLSPGNPVGNIMVTALSLEAGSNFTWRIAQLTTSDQSQWSNVQVVTSNEGDSLMIDGAANLTLDLSLLGGGQRPSNIDPLLNNAFWQTTETWQIVSFDGIGLNHFGSGGQLNPFTLTNGVFEGGVFSTFVGDGSNGFTAGNVYLQFTPVPEPSTWALLAGGAGILGLCAWRRKSRVRA